MKSWGFVMAENPMEPGQQDWEPGLALPGFSVPRMGKYIFPMGGRASGGHFHPVWRGFLEEQRNSGHKKLRWVQETHPRWGRRQAQGEGRRTSRMESDCPGQGSLKICQPCFPGDNQPYRLQAQRVSVCQLRLALAARTVPLLTISVPHPDNVGDTTSVDKVVRGWQHMRQRNGGDGPVHACVPQASSTEHIRTGGGENTWGQVKFRVLINLFKRWF